MTAREPQSGLERIPVGFPLQDTTLHVLDEDLRQLPPGEIGELCVGGPGVALGYLGLAELTAQRFVSDPVDGARLYRTGDLARQLPSGAIEVLGRRDCQVKLRGFRIELAEIEQSAMATGLCDAAVVEKIGEGPTAYLAGFVLPSSSVEDSDFLTVLSARLADRLPAYMIPARWVVLAELRFGPTGKLDRAQLLELLDEPAPEPAADAQLSGALGETLRQIWQDVLDVPCAAPGAVSWTSAGTRSPPCRSRLAALGVDEIACLIDFGLPAPQVLAALHPLARLRELCSAAGPVPAAAAPPSG